MPKLRARLLGWSEREYYKEHLNRFHYLGAPETNLSEALQYVVEDEHGTWLALVSWGYGALKNRSRDEWLGWDREQHDKRLRYVVTNTRFLVLPWAAKYKHIASQALSLVLKRLSVDWARYHGHHVLLAETFVDTQRFKGTCYKAANWIYVGETSGYGRDSKRYFEHGQKKAVFIYPLRRDVKEILTGRGFAHPLLCGEEEPRRKTMLDLNKLPFKEKGGLLSVFDSLADPRSRFGVRYKLKPVLALVSCAILAGADSILGIAEYGQQLPHEVRRRLGFRPFKMPSESVIRIVLNGIDAHKFDEALSAWIKRHVPSFRGQALAVDGKTMRAARNANGKAPHLLSVMLHRDALVVAQRAVGEKTNEIPELRKLLEPLDIKGAVVTIDAMHTQRDTAQFIVQEKRADYLMTVKGNQPELYDRLELLPRGAFSPGARNDR